VVSFIRSSLPIILPELFITIDTLAHNSQMPEVGDKPVFLEQGFLERGQQQFIEVDYSATATTNKVMMMSFICRMVPDAASPQVGLGDHAEFFQEVQGAVNCGYINIGESGSDLGMDFLGADVVIAVLNSREYHESLRGHPITLPAQQTGNILIPVHSTLPDFRDCIDYNRIKKFLQHIVFAISFNN
jgi:hypothetical protein